MEFRDRLYQLRRGRGISQEELANAVGVSRQAVQKWEAGSSTPDLENLSALAEYFGVTLDYLVRGVEPEASTIRHSTAASPAFKRSRIWENRSPIGIPPSSFYRIKPTTTFDCRQPQFGNSEHDGEAPAQKKRRNCILRRKNH